MKIDLEKPWDCSLPISIGGRDYKIATGDAGGRLLSPVAVALANKVAVLPVAGSCCDVGCGVGLIGMVASQHSRVTLLDSDESACELARINAANNGCLASVVSSPEEIPDQSFDSIFGSEIIYPSYQINRLCGFIQRTWNKRGPCLFSNSDGSFGPSFIARMSFFGIAVTQSEETFVLPNGDEIDYTLWTLTP